MSKSEYGAISQEPLGFEGKTPNAEFKEISDDQAKFLAAIFEMGASMSLDVINTTRQGAFGIMHHYMVAHPTLSFNDISEEKMQLFATIYGGSSKQQGNKNSWRWRLTKSSQVFYLLESIKPYAPHRREEIEAFEAFEQAESGEEKIAIVRALKEYQHLPKSYPDPSEYHGLVKDSPFVAGAYEGRGNVYDESQRTTLPFIISSMNISLLEALKREYGGFHVPVTNRPLRTSVDGRINVPFKYYLVGHDRIRFLQTAYPYIISNTAKIGAILRNVAH